LGARESLNAPRVHDKAKRMTLGSSNFGLTNSTKKYRDAIKQSKIFQTLCVISIEAAAIFPARVGWPKHRARARTFGPFGEPRPTHMAAND
jgi:hypothetical protein